MTIPRPHWGWTSRIFLFALIFLTEFVAAHSTHAQTFMVLYSFLGSPDGGGPNGVIRDGDGTLYGTTFWGGVSNGGAAFKLTPSGKEKVLYSFRAGYGNGPGSTLVRDTKGNLYGTTQGGGAYGPYGVIFKLDQRGNETVLYSFKGHSDGQYPSGVTLDDGGNLYGTTPWGGNGTDCADGCGTVFKLDKSGRKTVLYNFTFGTDGGAPYSGVIRDRVGNLYGTTSWGGDLSCNNGYGCGTVFMLDTIGKESVLYSFTGGTDGIQPYAGLVRDGGGNIYGTTEQGGVPGCGKEGGAGCGTVFKLDTSGNETVLYRFTGTGGDGAYPHAGVVLDPQGNLYGTTITGGSTNCTYGIEPGCGTVFMLDTTGKETILHTFAGNPDGAFPTGVIRDAAGDLYGAAAADGSPTCPRRFFGECGTVFKLTP